MFLDIEIWQKLNNPHTNIKKRATQSFPNLQKTTEFQRLQP